MRKATLKALKQSIKKWEGYAKATSPDEIHLGIESCPLCVRFLRGDREGGDCRSLDGCPVVKKSLATRCRFTPFDDVSVWLTRWRQGQLGGFASFRAAARREVDFLRSLLPEDE